MRLWIDEAWMHDRLDEVQRETAISSQAAADVLLEMKYVEPYTNHRIPGMLRLTPGGALRLQDLKIAAKRDVGAIAKVPYFSN